MHLSTVAAKPSLPPTCIMKVLSVLVRNNHQKTLVVGMLWWAYARSTIRALTLADAEEAQSLHVVLQSSKSSSHCYTWTKVLELPCYANAAVGRCAIRDMGKTISEYWGPARIRFVAFVISEYEWSQLGNTCCSMFTTFRNMVPQFYAQTMIAGSNAMTTGRKWLLTKVLTQAYLTAWVLKRTQTETRHCEGDVRARLHGVP